MNTFVLFMIEILLLSNAILWLVVVSMHRRMRLLCEKITELCDLLLEDVNV